MVDIVSKGYQMTVGATGEDWYRSHSWGAGKRYWVAGQGGVLRVFPLASGDRRIRITAGYFGGCGVVDYLPEDETIELPAVPSGGGTRYYLIAARRDWQAETTTMVTIAAANADTLPERQASPGLSQDDQPLALVSVTAGSSIASLVADVRAIGTGTVQFAGSEVALQYLRYMGSQVQIGDTLFTYGYLPGGGDGWLKLPAFTGGQQSIGLSTHFNELRSCVAYREGRMVSLRGRAQKKTGSIDARDGGWLVGTLPVGFRPVDGGMRWVVPGNSGDSPAALVQVTIDRDGRITALPVGSPSPNVFLDAVIFPAENV